MLGDRVTQLGGQQTFEVEVSQQSSEVPEEAIPSSPDDFIEEARQRSIEMQDEGSEWSAFTGAVGMATNDFLASAPDGLNLGDDTSCSGVGVSASSGGVSYSIERVVGSTSFQEEPDITKTTSDGNVVVVGTVDSPGRMNGDFGWSSDGNLIAGVLASFSHNWVGKLLAYFDRPTLPFNPDNEGWKLPNLVLAETEEPSQFHPVGSFKYNLRPSIFRQFTVSIIAPQDSVVGIDMWNSNKESVTRIESQEIPEGESELVISSAGYMQNSGFLNINPLDAPAGITITDVTSLPRAL